MTFPARDETTRVVEPREEPFDLPASARGGAHGHPAWTVDPAGVPRSSRCRTGSSDVRRGHRCRSRGRRSGASGGPRGSGRRGWRGRGAAHRVKRWPRGRLPLPRRVGPTAAPPLLAPPNVASTKARDRSILPRSRKSSASRWSRTSRRPDRCHRVKATRAGLIRRIAAADRATERPCARPRGRPTAYR